MPAEDVPISQMLANEVDFSWVKIITHVNPSSLNINSDGYAEGSVRKLIIILEFLNIILIHNV